MFETASGWLREYPETALLDIDHPVFRNAGFAVELRLHLSVESGAGVCDFDDEEYILRSRMSRAVTVGSSANQSGKRQRLRVV